MKQIKNKTLLAAILACNFALAQATPSNLVIESVKFDPPIGSTLPEQTPVLATIKFRFSKPASPLRAWVRIFDDKYSSQYIGVPESMSPGPHVITRGAYLTEPGTLEKMTVVFKDMGSNEVFRQDFPVQYTFVRDPALDAAKRDGVGSTVTRVSFPAGLQGTIKRGTFIPVELDYSINTPNGLFAATVPDTQCSMTYAGLSEPLRGTGRMQMGFTIGENCSIKRVKVLLRNAAEGRVYEKFLDVDLKIID